MNTLTVYGSQAILMNSDANTSQASGAEILKILKFICVHGRGRSRQGSLIDPGNTPNNRDLILITVDVEGNYV